MAKIMDPILPLLSILGYWAIVLGSFGGPGIHIICAHMYICIHEFTALFISGCAFTRYPVATKGAAGIACC